MNIETYIKNSYIEDYNTYKSSIGDCLCGRVVGKCCNDITEKKINLHSPKLFFLVSYELNLLNQIFHSHFPRHKESWAENALPFIDCICTYESQPQRIIYHLNHQKNDDISISRNEMLEADTYFLIYLEKKLQSINGPTLDDVIEAIKNDEDCKPETVLAYLKR